ncbi:rod shape-determining protein MreC [Rubinisphaera brasiliensis]|uniref:Cell shape-determining protein MreC n=1 Tax=Rubinisphaera brasiliensis (strain ATCC 49424 / DSM 5305 / JCM 21570 / IAM 15109 / NBRC 103401 / IFAM 1448) TaxID=756272 RepID=F0SN92_RUBBR|nr:rod shape-determining protein MreC [Rubinisphaera brasiliensis]ADY62135.1 hypothetical protein Plabr_4564 [Rubinisphaera brasiliensis DSM 5305]
MRQRPQTAANFLLLLWMGLGCAAMLFPAEMQATWKTGLRDAVAPTLAALHQLPLPEITSRDSSSSAAVEKDSDEQTAELKRQLALLHSDLQQLRSQQNNQGLTERLFHPQLVQAARLLPDQQERWREAGWLNVGNEKVREKDWVLKSDRPLVDVGTDQKVNVDQLLLTNRQIVGQIDQVGRWSSTYRPLTDEQFRCPATILNRETGQRYDDLAGSLHGQGEPECSLEYIANTIPVSVGDLVVLADPDRRFPAPLLLGEVKTATVAQNNPFWEIMVAPVTADETLREVSVITERLNPVRLAVPVNETEKGARK